MKFLHNDLASGPFDNNDSRTIFEDGWINEGYLLLQLSLVLLFNV